MKKILLLSIILSTFYANAQVLSYADQAVLFSKSDYLGTARYMGLSGAFGALGGDLTAIEVNPAGLGVFNKNMSAASLTYRNTDINSNFYGTQIYNSDDYFDFSQAGGVMVFNNYKNSGFKKFNLGFNYNIVKDFSNNYATTGNSGVPEFVDDPWLNYDNDDTNNIYYTNVDNQYFENYTSGYHSNFTFSFATQYEDLLYLGATMAFHYLNFNQNTYYEELNNDGNSNTLDAYNWQGLSTYSNGFNFGIGAILKPIQSVRLGVSYQSPIWYNLSERYIEDLDIVVSNDPETYIERSDPNYFDYELKTPAKLTGSLALVFGKYGLVSMDYIYQDYSKIRLQPSSAFIDDNNYISTDLTSTSSYRIGTEWRLKMLSFRGGYRMIQDPYKDSSSSFDTTGYSLGLGIKFSRNISVDFAYDKSTYDDQYYFLNIPGVNPSNLAFEDSRFTSTFSINF